MPMPQSALRQFTPQSAEPAVRSYNPFNPAFRETMRSGITDLLGGRAMGGTPTQRYRAGMADMLTGAVDFVPGVGEAVGVTDTVQAARGGNYGTAAMLGGATALGMLPVVGDVASKAVREGLDMSQAARMQTEYELAHEVAQRNAALPVEQGGLGLPLNNTAMDRAKAMGFDTTAYHGSGEVFDEFDPLKMGKTDDGWFGKGFYFSPKPEIANQYVAGRSPNVQQVLLKAENPYDWRVNEGGGMRLGTMDERYAKTREIMAKGHDSVDVYQDTIKLDKDSRLSDDLFTAIASRSLELDTPVMPRNMIEEALKNGMNRDDVVRYFGEDIARMMPVKRELVERVIFDPANIRSVNAAFDPAKRGSANLMAGAAGATIGLSALRNIQRDEERQPD